MNSQDQGPGSSAQELFFDQYSRYRQSADVIRTLLPAGGSVLDVGCGPTAALKTFLEDDERYRLTLVDPLLAHAPPSRHRLIAGTVFAPELEGERFDLVVSVDTLEHVPQAVRPAFLDRLLALSCGHVVLACPCADTDAGAAAQVDAHVNAVIEQVTSRSYPWLDEHFASELPRLSWITATVRQAGWSVRSFGNGHCPWLSELLPYVILAVEYNHDPAIARAISDIFNRQLYPFDRRPPSYRRIVVAARPGLALPDLGLGPEAGTGIGPEGQSGGRGEEDPVIAGALLEIRRLMLTHPVADAKIDALVRRSQGLLEDVVGRDAEINRLNGVVAKASEDLIALGRMVNRKDAELGRYNDELAARVAELGDLKATRHAASPAAPAPAAEPAAAPAGAVTFEGGPAAAGLGLVLGGGLRRQARQLARGMARRLYRSLVRQLRTRLLRPWLGRTIRDSRLFDAAFYREACPEVAASGVDPLAHYLRQGALEGRRPHPLFDGKFYLKSYPEVAAAGLNPLYHYLRWGAAAGYWPNPLFDSAYYLKTYPEVAASGQNPLVHYLHWGAENGHRPNPLFDGAHYLETCAEAAAAGATPLAHYLSRGTGGGGRPNPLFDGAYYLKTYPEVAATGLNPLAHYLRWGAAEGRRPNPLFDGAYYLKTYPEVAAAGLNPLAHYLQCGAAIGHRPNPLFDGAYYLKTHPEVAAAGLNPLAHYLDCGAGLGYQPNPLFDGKFYLKRYPEVAAAGLNPLHHYLLWGAAEGRKAHLSRRGDEPASRPQLPDPARAAALLPFTVPSAAAPAVSIVVPLAGAPLAGALCALSALAALAVPSRPAAAPPHPALPCQVLAVVAEDDAEARAALARVEGLELVGVAPGTGFGSACNQGAGVARGERLVFLAPDVVVRDGWLDELVWSLDHLPEAGLVGALVIDAEGWIEAEGETLHQDGSLVAAGRGDEPALSEHGHARVVAACPAGALIVAAGTFHRLGGFATEGNTALLTPERDLAFRLQDAGLKVYCQSTAVVVRLPAASGAPAGADAVAPSPSAIASRWPQRVARAAPPGLGGMDLERALGRRHLLVVDRRLPSFEGEPAGLAALMLLFAGLGYLVSFATPALPREREPGVRALERRGIHVLRHGPDVSVPAFLDRPEIKPDMVLFAHPGAAALLLPDLEELVSPARRVLIAAGFDTPRLALPGAEGDGWREDRGGLGLLHEVALTLVGNGSERDALRQAAPDCPTLVMPSIVPVAGPASGPEAGFSGRRDLALPARLENWQDGEAVVAFAVRDWPLISRRLAGPADAGLADTGLAEKVCLHILCPDTAPPAIRALQSAEILVREGAEAFAAGLSGARLAVAPQRSWGGFDPAAAAALAHGLPTVLSPQAARGLDLPLDGPFPVAEPGEAMADRVAALYHDRAAWSGLSAGARHHAEGHWSVEAVRQRIIQMLHRAGFVPSYEMSDRIARQALAAKGTPK